MDCLYEASTAENFIGHSTIIGTALDGNPLYGKYISVNGRSVEPSDLDACGGRIGVIPSFLYDLKNIVLYIF